MDYVGLVKEAQVLDDEKLRALNHTIVGILKDRNAIKSATTKAGLMVGQAVICTKSSGKDKYGNMVGTIEKKNPKKALLRIKRDDADNGSLFIKAGIFKDSFTLTCPYTMMQPYEGELEA